MREHLEHVDVVTQGNFPVHAALQEDLVGAFRLRLDGLLADFVQTKHIGFGAVRRPAKTAETAGDFAHVRVVHDAESGIAHTVSGIQALAYRVAYFRHFGPRGVLQYVERFGRSESGAVNGFLQERVHSGPLLFRIAAVENRDVPFFLAQVLFANLEGKVHQVVLEHLLVGLAGLHVLQGAGAVVDALHEFCLVGGRALRKDAFVHDGVFHRAVVTALALVFQVGLCGHLLDDSLRRNVVNYLVCNKARDEEQQAYRRLDKEALAAAYLVVAALYRLECLGGMQSDVIKIVLSHRFPPASRFRGVCGSRPRSRARSLR